MNTIGGSDNVAHNQLSDAQETLLVFFPIPSAILSITGSVIIIAMAFRSRQNKPWTPYHGLLTGMSLYDIMFSITLAVGSFLFPKDTSDKLWALGNEATCDGVAFMTQLSYATIMYNSVLSIYFLLTTKYGYSNQEISARFETSMHVLCLGWPLLTAYAGLYLNLYGEREANMGCWVRTDIPQNCGAEEGKTGEDCLPQQLALLAFGGLIFVPSFLVIIINNLVIWLFVRKQVDYSQERLIDLQKAAITEETEKEYTETSEGIVEFSLRTTKTSDVRISNKERRLAELKRRQLERLRLIRSQAVLFVGSFFICNLPTYLLRLIEARTTTEAGFKELSYRYFPLLLLQSFLYPLQGLLNLIVYTRPKYLSNRYNFPSESNLWAFRRAIFGAAIEPQTDCKGVDSSGKIKSSKTKNSFNSGEDLSGSEVPPVIEPRQIQVNFRMGADSIIEDDEDLDAWDQQGEHGVTL